MPAEAAEKGQRAFEKHKKAKKNHIWYDCGSDSAFECCRMVYFGV